MVRAAVFLGVALAALAALTSAWLASAPESTQPPAPIQATPVLDAPAPDAEELHTLQILREQRTGLSPNELPGLARAIVSEARRRGLEPALVLAVIHVESRGYNFAVSGVGAQGLMQLMPATGRELAQREGIEWQGSGTLFDPVVNVRLGTRYLRQLADRYDGDIAKALAAYNWGPAALDRRLRRGESVPKLYREAVLEARAETQQLASTS